MVESPGAVDDPNEKFGVPSNGIVCGLIKIEEEDDDDEDDDR